MKQNIINHIKIITVAVIVGLSVGLFAFAQTFTFPTQTPPQGNVAAPINVGPDQQTRMGRLNINNLLNVFALSSIDTWSKNLYVLGGLVSFTPGTIFRYGTNAGVNKILVSSDNTGTAVWKTAQELGLGSQQQTPSQSIEPVTVFFQKQLDCSAGKCGPGTSNVRYTQPCPSSHPVALTVMGECETSSGNATGIARMSAGGNGGRLECMNSNSVVKSVTLVCISNGITTTAGAGTNPNYSWQDVTLSSGSTNQTCTNWLSAGGQQSADGTPPRVFQSSQTQSADRCIYQLGTGTVSSPSWTTSNVMLGASNPNAIFQTLGGTWTVYRPISNGTLLGGGGGRTQTYR